MSAPVRYSLNVSVIDSYREGAKPFLDIDCQVWRDAEHITTIKLVQLQEFDWPEAADLDSVENYALVATRVAARWLANIQMDAVENGHLRGSANFLEPTDAH